MFLKKQFINLFVVLITNSIFGQTLFFKGEILDKKTKDPIAYASLLFLDSSIGTATNEQGRFNIELREKDLKSKVLISCINYKDTIVLTSQLKNKTFYLRPTVEVLDEVVLRKRKIKEVVLDPVKRKVKYMLPFNKTSGVQMNAKYFPYTSKNNGVDYIKDITIKYYRRSYKCKGKYRLRIFDRDIKTGKPKKDILKKNIILTMLANDKSIVLDLSKYDIQVPKNGFFVALEFFYIPFNNCTTASREKSSYKTYLKNFNKNLDSLKKINPYTTSNVPLDYFTYIIERAYYGPMIGVTKSKFYKKNICRSYYLKNGKWEKYKCNVNDNQIVLPISVTLTN
ncbi:MAG: carboxypeptidase-like regulatory domain-containing protein [Polaribacter sp.]